MEEAATLLVGALSLYRVPPQAPPRPPPPSHHHHHRDMRGRNASPKETPAEHNRQKQKLQVVISDLRHRHLSLTFASFYVFYFGSCCLTFLLLVWLH
jgi:hypothetical protein